MSDHSAMSDAPSGWPALAWEGWQPTRETLHRFAQILGKVRLAKYPPNAVAGQSLPLSACGITTGPLPYAAEGAQLFSLELDWVAHCLRLASSRSGARSEALAGLSVAGFYHQVLACLAEAGADVAFRAVPVDLHPATPFPSDEAHATYDAEAVARLWHALREGHAVLRAVGERMSGRAGPVTFGWYRFALESPLRVAVPAGARRPTVVFQFHPGTAHVPYPAFRLWVAPAPAGLTSYPLPEGGQWVAEGDGALAVLDYEHLRRQRTAHGTAVSFLLEAAEAVRDALGGPRERQLPLI